MQWRKRTPLLLVGIVALRGRRTAGTRGGEQSIVTLEGEDLASQCDHLDGDAAHAIRRAGARPIGVVVAWGQLGFDQVDGFGGDIHGTQVPDRFEFFGAIGFEPRPKAQY